MPRSGIGLNELLGRRHVNTGLLKNSLDPRPSVLLCWIQFLTVASVVELTFVEGGQHIPFDIQRVYYLYDVPGGAERGGHAHKGLQQLIVAMSGSFDVVLDDGRSKQRFHLNRSYQGLYVCPMIWRELDNFSSGSVCMVLASNRYDEDDYYRDYGDYMKAQGLA